MIEDAAEALGASFGNKPAGSFGRYAILSFNGNKIITTSGGGALLTNDTQAAERARFLATQARDPAPHYQHSELGYNYRMSNILAALGRGQLEHLAHRVFARRANRDYYANLFEGVDGVQMAPFDVGGRSNAWLTCILIDSTVSGVDRETVRTSLDAASIEARPTWKPMHLQPVFSEARMVGGKVCEDIFRDGLCLPSGSNLSDDDRRRIRAELANIFELLA